MLQRFGTRGEQRNAMYFVVAVAVICCVWFFGFGLHANLWKQDEEIVVQPGMWKVFTGGISSLVWVTILISIASAGYLVAIRMLHRGFNHGWAAAITASVLASLAIFPQMPMASPDAGHLSADVRTLWLRHVIPSGGNGAPADFEGDPVASKIEVLAGGQSGYGTLSYVIGGLPLPFVGDDLANNIAGQKAVAGIFMLIAAIGAGYLARTLGGNPGFATAFVGLNPLMLFQFPGDGHNDSIMAAFGALAILFAISTAIRDRAISLAFFGASFASKYSYVFVGPIILVYWFPRFRHVVGALTLLGGAAFVYVILFDPPIPAGAVVPAVAVGRNSPWAIVFLATDVSRANLAAIAFSSFFLLLAAVVWFQPIKEKQEVVMLCGATLWMLMFVGMASYSPWYQVWYLPLVAASGSRWLMGVAITFSIGTFATILSRNWLANIIFDLSIDDPIEKATAAAWIATAAVGLLLWYLDQQRRRDDSRPARMRRQRGLPARRRRRA